MIFSESLSIFKYYIEHICEWSESLYFTFVLFSISLIQLIWQKCLFCVHVQYGFNYFRIRVSQVFQFYYFIQILQIKSLKHFLPSIFIQNYILLLLLKSFLVLKLQPFLKYAINYLIGSWHSLKLKIKPHKFYILVKLITLGFFDFYIILLD